MRVELSFILIAALLLVSVLIVSIASFAVLMYLRRRGESRRVLQERVAELQALSESVRAIASTELDEDALCKLAYERVAQLVDAQTFQLGLFENEDYITKLRFTRGIRQPVERFNLKNSPGIVGWMRETGKSLLVRDFARELDTLPAKPRYISEHPPKSGAFVPMITVDGVMGAMVIQSDNLAAYTESHLRLLSIIGNQTAAAIQNARALQRERQSARQLALVSQVASQTAAILDFQELLPRLIDAMRKTFGYYFIGIFLIDEETQAMVCRAASHPDQLGLRIPHHQGLVGASARNNALMFADDVSTDQNYLSVDTLPFTKSEAVVPLKIGDKVIGVLDLQSDQVGTFTHADKTFLEILASQVAVAIEDARLYEAEREQTWLSTALLKVAEVGTHADDMDETLQTLAQRVRMLSDVDTCAVLLSDEHFSAFTLSAIEGRLSAHENLVVGDTLMVEDVPAIRNMLDTEAPATSEVYGRLMRPILAVPLMAQNVLIGVLLAGRKDNDLFNKRRIVMLTGMAYQVALVIDAVRARVAQQEESWVTAALLQVAQAMSQSDSLENIADTVVRLAPLLVGVDACAVFVRDGADANLRALGGYGFAEAAQQMLRENDFPIAAWRDWVKAREQSGLSTAETKKTLQFFDVPEVVAERLGTCYFQAISLLAKSHLVGALVVGKRDQPSLNLKPRSVAILSGITQQTAVAIDSARLYLESMERQRLEQELSLARDIQTSFLPKEAPIVDGWSIAGAWESARQVGGDFYDYIKLPDDRYGLVIADVADKGMAAALFMIMSRTLTRAAAIAGREPADLLSRVNRYILNDVRSDLFVTLVFMRWYPLTGLIEYANAGHNPPLLFRHDPHGGPEVAPLIGSGIALGVLEAINPIIFTETLQPGDVLLMYTDGITDALNIHNEEFGMARLYSVLQANASKSAQEIVNTLMQAVDDFAGDEPPFDDQTLLVLKRDL